MDSSLRKRNVQSARRVLRVRKKLRGNAERPRLNVFKSNRHIAVQLIDDEKAVTLASVSTMTKEMQDAKLGRKSKEAARKLGADIAELAKKQKIQAVVFDRGANKYHGLLAELANAARESGLQF